MADQDEFLMDSDTSHEDEEEGGHHVLKIFELWEGSRDSTSQNFSKVASYGVNPNFFQVCIFFFITTLSCMSLLMDFFSIKKSLAY